MIGSIRSLAKTFIFSNPFESAISASLPRRVVKSSFLATKSVSHKRETKTAFLPACAGRSFSLIVTAPSLTSRLPFLSAMSELVFFKIASAFFISPSASSRACLHCITEIPVASLNSLIISVAMESGILFFDRDDHSSAFVSACYGLSEELYRRNAGIIADNRVLNAFNDSAMFLVIFLASGLVPTKSIILPAAPKLLANSDALSSILLVFSKSIISVLFLVAYIYFDRLGCLRVFE